MNLFRRNKRCNSKMHSVFNTPNLPDPIPCQLMSDEHATEAGLPVHTWTDDGSVMNWTTQGNQTNIILCYIR